MKKFLVLSLISILTILGGISSTNAQSLDLESLDGLIEDSPTSESTNTSSDSVTITNLDVMFKDGSSIPAGGTKSNLMVKVTDSNGKALDDTAVLVEANIVSDDASDVGTVGSITYNLEGEYFDVPYTTGKDKGTVFFTLKATSIADSSISLEQGEEVTITEAVASPAPESQEPVIENTADSNSESTTTEVTEEIIGTETKPEEENGNTEEDVEIEANVLSTKVLGENRIVVNFDRELFLPEEPLSLVTIEKMGNSHENTAATTENEDSENTESTKEELKIANVTLGDDKKSLVILTTDAIGKDQYKLTINEVVDGETKKRINVVNGELTVTGFAEIAVLALALLLFTGIFFLRKRK